MQLTNRLLKVRWEVWFSALILRLQIRTLSRTTATALTFVSFSRSLKRGAFRFLRAMIFFYRPFRHFLLKLESFPGLPLRFHSRAQAVMRFCAFFIAPLDFLFRRRAMVVFPFRAALSRRCRRGVVCYFRRLLRLTNAFFTAAVGLLNPCPPVM